MMNYIWCAIILLSVVFSVACGNTADLSSTIIASGKDSIEFLIGILGIFCFWGGIMNVIEKSGLNKLFSKALSPIIRLLFKEVDPKSKLFDAISLSMAAGLLGLGNASTPLGISVMKEFAKDRTNGYTATNNMVMFVVLNSTALKVFPSTIAAVRQNNGAANPLDFLTASLVASFASAATGIILTKILGGKKYE